MVEPYPALHHSLPSFDSFEQAHSKFVHMHRQRRHDVEAFHSTTLFIVTATLLLPILHVSSTKILHFEVQIQTTDAGCQLGFLQICSTCDSLI